MKNIVISRSLVNKFIIELKRRYPRKTLGYFISSTKLGEPEDFIIFENNDIEARNKVFDSYGAYYKIHQDAGCIATPDESLRVEKILKERKLFPVGVFHTHNRMPTLFNYVDQELHISPYLWHIICSFRNYELPQIRAYTLINGFAVEIEIDYFDETESNDLPKIKRNDKDIYQELEYILRCNKKGEHLERDNKIIYHAINASNTFSTELKRSLLYDRYIKDATERFADILSDYMVIIPGGSYYMDFNDACNTDIGETPCREIRLDSFAISKSLITEKIYKLFDSEYKVINPNLPVTNISWYDAMVFSFWLGVSLPSENQWEYSCGCDLCVDNISKFAWCSESNVTCIQPVMQLQKNEFGLYDMLGNVWEWCLDSFESDHYQYSAKANPTNAKNISKKICRGGSIYATTDICRRGFRHYEHADFFALDLGFRVVLNDI